MEYFSYKECHLEDSFSYKQIIFPKLINVLFILKLKLDSKKLKKIHNGIFSKINFSKSIICKLEILCGLLLLKTRFEYFSCFVQTSDDETRKRLLFALLNINKKREILELKLKRKSFNLQVKICEGVGVCICEKSFINHTYSCINEANEPTVLLPTKEEYEALVLEKYKNSLDKVLSLIQ